jgi:hypothetical protein
MKPYIVTHWLASLNYYVKIFENNFEIKVNKRFFKFLKFYKISKIFY